MDPRKMKHEEKLAFWVNIHNSMMMHVWLVSSLCYIQSFFLVDDEEKPNCIAFQAYLVYGIPQKNTKKESLLIRVTHSYIQI